MEYEPAIAWMLEQSRISADRTRQRLAALTRGAAIDTLERLVDDAADALLACHMVEQCGGLLARTSARRLRQELERELAPIQAQRAITVRLKDKVDGLSRLLARRPPAASLPRSERGPPLAARAAG